MAGFVYIMSNPLFARIKIGKSTKDPTGDRLDELNRETGTPEKYKCEYYAFVGDEHGLELAVHKEFSDRRPNPKREFFEVSISEAVNTIENLAPDFGDIKHAESYHEDLELEGPIYDGEYENGVRDGQGTLTWADGAKYVGHWWGGKKNGQGRLTLANGNQYDGEWKYDKFHGQGTYTWANGNQYVGQWKDGQKHGQGTFTLADGGQYVGEFKDDNFHGQGTHTLADGNQYVGEWSYGKRNV